MLRPLLLAALIGVNALAQTAAVEGLVRDAAKQPVAGATVSLKSSASESAGTTLSAKDGSFHFAGLGEGPYSLTARKSGFHEAAASIVLKSQKTTRVDLVMAPEKAPDFSDEPTFTVAGVTDPGHGGGHGSDAILRSTETLAKETAALGSASNADGLRALGDVEESLGHPLEAVQAFQRAAELAPTEPNLFAWGADLLKHRAPEQAAEVFTKGTSLYPKSARMLLGLAAASYALGSYDKAAESFFQATDLDPADPTPYLFLGRVEDMNTALEQGIVVRLERFARLQPENALANYYYAASLWKQRPDAATTAIAEPLLEKAVRLDPKLSAASLQLGIVLEAKNDLPAAITSYRKALDADPDMTQAHYRLGQAYKRIGDSERARQEFALYSEASKKSAAQAERERSEIQEFVFTLRSGDSMSGGRPGAH